MRNNIIVKHEYRDGFIVCFIIVTNGKDDVIVDSFQVAFEDDWEPKTHSKMYSLELLSMHKIDF